MARDFYDVLGVNRNASQDDIKKSYRRLAKKYHPDSNPDDPSAETKFKELNEAYEVLQNPDTRAQYDRFGQNFQQYQQAGGPNGQGFYTTVDFEDIAQSPFGDLFESVFGGFGRGASGRNRAETMLRMDGRDIEQPVIISLREAYEGTTRIITKEGRKLKVNIPRGATDGTKVRLSGEGEPGVNGGNSGNLLLIVQIQPDSQFQRDGDDLQIDIEVDMFTAMLGGEIEVPTMERPVRLKIPAGTQSGRKFRLTGKGMPIMRKKGQHGNLYARVQISVPESLTSEQRKLVEKLRDTFA